MKKLPTHPWRPQASPADPREKCPASPSGGCAAPALARCLTCLLQRPEAGTSLRKPARSGERSEHITEKQSPEAPAGPVPPSPAWLQQRPWGCPQAAQETSPQLQKTVLLTPTPASHQPFFSPHRDSSSLESPLMLAGAPARRPGAGSLSVWWPVSPGTGTGDALAARWHRALAGKPSVLPRCLSSPPHQSHPEPRAWCQIEL